MPSTPGALVSVGTFRGLDVASSGKISHLILLDYNRGIKLFNLVNLQLIRLSRNRCEYLSLLITGERSGSLYADDCSDKIPLRDFIKRLTEPLLKDSSHGRSTLDSKRLVPKWRQLGVKLPNEEDWKVMNIGGENGPLETIMWEGFRKPLTNFPTLIHSTKLSWVTANVLR